MKDIFKPGDKKIHAVIIKSDDAAVFNNEVVHNVCSTFALAREIEWSTRLFVLEMKADDEEGIGTKLEINHRGPALIGEELIIEASVRSIVKNEILCTYMARVGSRLVAEGVTGQKILKKARIAEIFST